MYIYIYIYEYTHLAANVPTPSGATKQPPYIGNPLDFL